MLHIKQETSNWFIQQHKRILWFIGGVAFIVFISLGLTWITTGFLHFHGWFPFMATALLGSGFLYGGWWLIRAEKPPGWLVFLLISAALVRLILGVVWFVALPIAGYDSPAERKGYIMADAYNRDRAAWQFGLSKKPVSKIITGLQDYKKYDQYGGMLFTSSMVYRLADGKKHQPLLVVVITASFSSLAVLFTWAFSKLAWGEKVAQIAAWGIAVYPEAVLLGSSQMREAILIPLITLAFYGLLRYLKNRNWKDLILIIAPLLLCLPFSSPATALTLLLLVILALICGEYHIFQHYKLWFILGGLAVLALMGIWIAWNNYAPTKITDPFSLVAWWLRVSTGMQVRLSHLDSGWVQKVFNNIPEWTQFPFMLIYGIIRPFLPAALLDFSSKSIWHLIAIWRAIGWAMLLPLLIYAPLLLLKKQDKEHRWEHAIGRGLSLVIWLAILAASLRGGADLWDNPRYRAMYAGIQIALASWIWFSYRNNRDVWLERLVVCIGIILLWFVPWYLRRYTPISWPVVSFFKTLVLGLVSSVLYLLWDLTRSLKSD